MKKRHVHALRLVAVSEQEIAGAVQTYQRAMQQKLAHYVQRN